MSQITACHPLHRIAGGALALVFGGWMAAATPADRIVFDAMRRADRTLVHERILFRGSAGRGLDLVIAAGSSKDWSIGNGPTIWWNQQRKIGLFLQSRTRLEQVETLALQAGTFGGNARIERVTASEAVISCVGEGIDPGRNEKFVYDARTKTLVRHFSYPLVPMSRVEGNIFRASDGSGIGVKMLPGPAAAFRIFRFDSKMQPIDNELPLWFGRGFRLQKGSIVDGRGKTYPLPQSTYSQFAKARPRRVKDNYLRVNTIIEEEIGPAVAKSSRLWFGKTFYDGEGNSGVGGFGYFDASERKFHLFAPREIVDDSVTAIGLDGGAVWLGIASFGEGSGTPDGLLRYELATGSVTKYEIADTIYGLSISPGRVAMGTSGGIAVLEHGRVRRYFVDRTVDGKLTVVEANR